MIGHVLSMICDESAARGSKIAKTSPPTKGSTLFSPIGLAR